jgi:glycosyltransferase involved in cell wall biosynthesis
LLPARLLASRHRRPLVYHCHDFADRNCTLSLGSRLVRAFQHYFARTADLVIVPDAERGALIARELHLKRAPLLVANAPLSRPAAKGEALRQALCQRGASFERVVFRQGRIGTGHGIEVTLRSMPLWASENWGFAVMGIAEPAYLGQLSALAQALGVEKRFVVLPPVGYDQVAQFTPGADLGHALYEPVHFNHTYFTTASNKVMEYMAAGLPLLISDTPVSRALLEKYACGLTADHSRPESVAAAVNCLLGDPARARQMGAAAARAFEQVFCYERQFAPALDAVRALTGEKTHE